MRPLVNQIRIHVSEPEFSSSLREPAAEKCENQTCPWWPYSNSKEFKTNAGLIVLFLFLAILSALAINASIRYFLRRRRRHRQQSESRGGLEQEQSQSKEGHWWGETHVEETPTVVFSSGMKVAGECAICLSEFVEGEGIRVLNGCSHGFHVECIHKWLNCRSSCPTCRAICLPPCSSTELPGCSLGNHAHTDFPSAVTQNPRGPEMILV